MFKKTKIVAVLVVLLTSCNTSNKTTDAENTVVEDTLVENTQTETISPIKKECFRNEMPYKDGSGLKDIEELNYTLLENQKVTGVYNWLPAEKDQREGTFEGTLEGNKINGMYKFQQEGIQDSTSITIMLENNQVVVSGGDEALGLSATLPKADCQD